MFFKVCKIVSAQKLIQTKKDADSWEIEQSQPSIILISFAESNLRLFFWFLNRCSRFGRLDNSRHRKYEAQERWGNVQMGWRIDREWDDESTCQANRRRGCLKASSQRWRSGIRGRSLLKRHLRRHLKGKQRWESESETHEGRKSEGNFVFCRRRRWRGPLQRD